MEFKQPNIDEDLKEIIPAFIDNTQVDFEKFQLAYGDKDVEAMKHVCHTILGTAISYGFEELDEIVRNIKNLVDEGELDKIQEQNEVFKKYIEFISTKLKY
ncbi:hypothetical protein BALOs_1009 [Halobacteriovorax sp. BALOs_7]|uniref:Hpt domain-containing protein n=1 Tax=Halobacteriovorax vibrionivorans TaxID=2152716 RepID=A0ABY0IG12_9BACT|nr:MULTISPECIES: Hpt domain-containing protein [Halobacteriovorax]AYF44019.1 hypothetical protein BALOs_1009 [Halobacteriovorax sp. BALOs_7]RZF21454.1 Hpt domain-containing protein [Halobacteriovorax vibrionivorans]TGD48727.1 Hpt domain-containing protein [Halobacteriovorax sp. Y22]